MRAVGVRHPGLQRIGGRFGIGRLLARGNSRQITTIDGDIRLELDLSVPIYRHIYYYYDIDGALETHLIKRIATSDTVMIDAGAHIGYFTLIGAKYAGRVYAFEPSHATFAYLERNIRLNPALAAKVKLSECGLSDIEDVLRFYNSQSHLWAGSLRPLDIENSFFEEVRVLKLDDALRDEEARVTLVKIDVEGAELDVLRGAIDTLARDKPVIVLELVQGHQARFGRTCGDVVAFLDQHGYDGYSAKLLQPGLALTPIALTSDGEADSVDAVFLPRESARDLMPKLTS